jgi:hypothetical protein
MTEMGLVKFATLTLQVGQAARQSSWNVTSMLPIVVTTSVTSPRASRKSPVPFNA